MSLLESCVSVAILSIVVFFGAPSLVRARENYQLQQVARQAGSNLQLTRVKAISRSRDCRVRVTSATSYVIECQDPVWITDATISLPEGFQITATASPEFHKRGNAAPAGTLTITDSRSRSKSVTVNITGRVRVN
jgi:type II secretory pathway pseudopilin PulG